MELVPTSKLQQGLDGLQEGCAWCLRGEEHASEFRSNVLLLPPVSRLTAAKGEIQGVAPLAAPDGLDGSELDGACQR